MRPFKLPDSTPQPEGEEVANWYKDSWDKGEITNSDLLHILAQERRNTNDLLKELKAVIAYVENSRTMALPTVMQDSALKLIRKIETC